VENQVEKAVKGSDLVVILTDHNEFKIIDEATCSLMNSKRVFDTRDVVESTFGYVEYNSFGNLFEFLSKEVVLV
jgi:UDP-N-acetyl-D-mannosaminuronic acid dehydrogenase